MTSAALLPPPVAQARPNDDRARPTPPPDPFRYGFRFERVKTADGEYELREVPLSYQDLLDPKEGDYMIQATVHTRLNAELLHMLTNRYRGRGDVAVFHDLKMLWCIPGLSQPCPDIAVVPNIRDKHRERRSFDVVKEGTRPGLIVEVVSPEYRNKDYGDLPRIYERARIDEYLIVDPGPTEIDAPLRLSGYRLDAGGHYRPIEADARGRLYSATTGLIFGPDPVERRLVIEDALNGNPLLHPDEEQAALEDARRRAAEEAVRAAEEAVRAAEEAAHAAEETAHAAEEAAARRVAEMRVVEEAAARRAAEMRAAEEADARRALEIELERLRKQRQRGGEH